MDRKQIYQDYREIIQTLTQKYSEKGLTETHIKRLLSHYWRTIHAYCKEDKYSRIPVIGLGYLESKIIKNKNDKAERKRKREERKKNKELQQIAKANLLRVQEPDISEQGSSGDS